MEVSEGPKSDGKIDFFSFYFIFPVLTCQFQDYIDLITEIQMFL